MRSILQAMTLAVVCLAPSFGFAQVKSGDLLFVQNSHNVVECYTHSSYSHVAMAMKEGDETWVYEAEIPVVTRYTLKQWLTTIGNHNSDRPQSPAVITVVRPQKAYTDSEIKKMKAYLDKQRGRRYSLRGYVRNTPGNGIHCSELCSGAMEASERFKFSTPNYAIAPYTLLRSLSKTHHQCGPRLKVTLRADQRMSWCERSAAWWSKRPTFCLWSCWETIRFWP